MKYAVVTMSVAALMLGSLAGLAEAKAKAGKSVATPSTHTGVFVSAADGRLVMSGEKGKEHSHPLAKDAKFTIDGKRGTLDGFKKGMHISVTTDKSGHATAVSTVAAKPATSATKAAPATKAVKATTTTPAAKSAKTAAK